VAVVSDRRVHLLVTGSVQGVGFRWFARERAHALRIRGWIRNQGNGNVELVAGGTGADVQAFIEVIGRGPPRSRVEELQVRDELSDDDLPFPFEIRS
jgi:acylphosphatase